MFIQEFKDITDISHHYCGTSKEDLENAIIHIAWYGYGCYCGASLVVYEKDNKLYEVNGSHCSCYGLEDQWTPEETSWRALSIRPLFSDEYEGYSKVNECLQELVTQNLQKEEPKDAPNPEEIH